MHVVIATQHYPTRYVGGVEIYSQWIARALADLGCIVTVIALEDFGALPHRQSHPRSRTKAGYACFGYEYAKIVLDV